MKQALIIIDLINDITGKHGLSNACYEQTAARNLIAATRETARQARQREIPVVWVRVGFADDWHDIPAGSPMFHRAKESGALKLSGSGCDWADGTDVQKEDICFVKKGVSAFAGNDLLIWLRKAGIDHIVLAGVSTVMAIQSTARYAHDSGFYVSVAEDLCAAPTAELHQISLEMLRPMATITTSAAWLAQ